MIQYTHIICKDYVPSCPRGSENPPIVDAALKRLCIILSTLKHASQTHFKDLLINTVIM